MKTGLIVLAAGALLALAMASPLAAAPRNVTDPDAPRTLQPSASPVQVSWTDPAEFTEMRHSRNRWEAQRGNWIAQLAEHLQERAERALPPGQRLEVVITDIKRAGDFEPWAGMHLRDVRVMRDIYPPRMDLQFTRYDASGVVIDQGQRNLVDMAYLGRVGIGSDALRYEKRLVDDWVRQELAGTGTARR